MGSKQVQKLPHRGPPSNELRAWLRGRAEADWLYRLDELAMGEDKKLALAAIEVGLRYGVGAARDIDLEKVRSNLLATLEAIREELEPERAERLIRRIAPIWR